MSEEIPEVVTLLDQDGAEREFRLHDVFDLEDVAYYLVESMDDPAVVLLLRESEGGLEPVEGDEFDRVIARMEEES